MTLTLVALLPSQFVPPTLRGGCPGDETISSYFEPHEGLCSESSILRI